MSDITFTLGMSQFYDMPTRRAACEHLGLEETHIHALIRANQPLTITATAAQFGMFIAARCVNGCKANTVIELNPKLICDPRPCPKPELVTKLDIRNASRC